MILSIIALVVSVAALGVALYSLKQRVVPIKKGAVVHMTTERENRVMERLG